jgi:hypothetical protein
MGGADYVIGFMKFCFGIEAPPGYIQTICRKYFTNDAGPKHIRRQNVVVINNVYTGDGIHGSNDQ